MRLRLFGKPADLGRVLALTPLTFGLFERGAHLVERLAESARGAILREEATSGFG